MRGAAVPRGPVLPAQRVPDHAAAAARAPGRRAARWSSTSCAATAPRPTSSRPRRCARSSATRFPGNVRELEHTLERALILAGSDPIGLEHLSFARPELLRGAAPACRPGCPTIPPEGLSLEVLERELILQALERARGNKSQAARLLGLTRRTLYSRMERHGLRTAGRGGDERRRRRRGAGERSAASGSGDHEPAARTAVRQPRAQAGGAAAGGAGLPQRLHRPAGDDDGVVPGRSSPICADSLSLSGPVPAGGAGRAARHRQAAHPAARAPSRALRGLARRRRHRPLRALAEPEDLPIGTPRGHVGGAAGGPARDRTHASTARCSAGFRCASRSRAPRRPASSRWAPRTRAPTACSIIGPYRALSALDSVNLNVVRIDGRRDTLRAQAAPEGLPDWCASDPPVVMVMVPLARAPKSP